jgi:hypothetical protein
MKYHTVHSAIWEDEKIQEVSTDAVLLYVYLFSNYRCSFSGIYKISPKTIENETRLPEVRSLLTELSKEGLIAYDFKKNAVWVRGKLKHHKSTFDSWCIAKSIWNDLEEFRSCSFLEALTTKYPELLELSITLERLRKQRYKTKEMKQITDGKADTVSESVSVTVRGVSRGSQEGIEGVSNE